MTLAKCSAQFLRANGWVSLCAVLGAVFVLIVICSSINKSYGGPSEARQYECLIQPNQTVEIRSTTEGIIEKIFVKRGDPVKAGQPVVKLESSLEESNVAMAKQRAQMTGRISAAEHRLRLANLSLDRAHQLKPQNFVSTQGVDEAEASQKVAEAELRDAIEAQSLAKLEYQRAINILNLRTLRSPFDGVVVDRMVNPGDLAEAGVGRKPILKLAQIEPLLVEVALPMEAFGKIQVGTIGKVVPENLGGNHTATVTIADSLFDAASGLFGVRLELPNNNGEIPSGIRCRVEFSGLNLPSQNTRKTQ